MQAHFTAYPVQDFTNQTVFNLFLKSICGFRVHIPTFSGTNVSLFSNIDIDGGVDQSSVGVAQ